MLCKTSGLLERREATDSTRPAAPPMRGRAEAPPAKSRRGSGWREDYPVTSAGQAAYGTAVNRAERDHDGLAMWSPSCPLETLSRCSLWVCSVSWDRRGEAC